MIHVHNMEEKCVERKKPRKLRKDKGKSKLSTAGKLIGVNETITEDSSKADNSVCEYFKDIITTFHEDVCYN